mmetsp:Transcript_20834/g.37519  ORF Transcript_20834/g.37519 Transcript_20834/m.37519 type:complete len:210 (+) Transcript_20834:534-1163(+)
MAQNGKDVFGTSSSLLSIAGISPAAVFRCVTRFSLRVLPSLSETVSMCQHSICQLYTGLLRCTFSISPSTSSMPSTAFDKASFTPFLRKQKLTQYNPAHTAAPTRIGTKKSSIKNNKRQTKKTVKSNDWPEIVILLFEAAWIAPSPLALLSKPLKRSWPNSPSSAASATSSPRRRAPISTSLCSSIFSSVSAACNMSSSTFTLSLFSRN